MSIKMNAVAPAKKEIAKFLRAVATLIEAANNETVSVNLDVTFNEKKREKQ